MLIIQFLQPYFKLYYLESDQKIPHQLNVDDEIYSLDNLSSENKGFIGFFDWLRIDESNIVGIRICFFEHHEYNYLLKHYPYVKIKNNGRWVELLFSGISFKEELSGDQDFTNNYVYKSSENNYLFTFGTDQLTQDELNSLLIQCESKTLNVL